MPAAPYRQVKDWKAAQYVKRKRARKDPLRGNQSSRSAAAAATTSHAACPVRSARAIKPPASDAAQHAGKSTAASVLPLLLDLTTSVAIAALLGVGNGRHGDDARRKAGEDKAPHRYRPNRLRHASY
jgi:hypothetical protein